MNWRPRLDISAVAVIFSPIMQPNHCSAAADRSPGVAGVRGAATRAIEQRQARRKGFTMMELLVVLAILGLLAGLAISNIHGIFGGAQVTTAQLFVKESMKSPLFTYRMHMGDYPSTEEGLGALINRPSNKGSQWHGPYITESKIPVDPWGEPYQYAYPGTHNKGAYDLWSKGPDKQNGTEDDIGNWDTGSAQK